jgi:biopolymer transport protein ExbD
MKSKSDSVRFGGYDEELMVGINVTPLVDVCLVLVIIFMVTAPLLVEPAFKVKLPITHVLDKDEEKDKVTVSLGAEGRLAVDSDQIKSAGSEGTKAYDQLKRLVTYKLQMSESKLVVIRADREATHLMLTDVMAVAKDSGAKQIKIATKQKKK